MTIRWQVHSLSDGLDRPGAVLDRSPVAILGLRQQQPPVEEEVLSGRKGRRRPLPAAGHSQVGLDAEQLVPDLGVGRDPEHRDVGSEHGEGARDGVLQLLDLAGLVVVAAGLVLGRLAGWFRLSGGKRSAELEEKHVEKY